jgi:hypothetical protein
VPGVVGEPYADAPGNERALSRSVTPAVYTQELFATGHDEANRAAVLASQPRSSIWWGSLRAERKTVDKIVDRLRFHP